MFVEHRTGGSRGQCGGGARGWKLGVNERYPAEQAPRIASRLEFHHTPVHASWLNMVEIEFSVLVRQCLSRRMSDTDTLSRETARNAAHVKPDWRFTARDARTKLTRRYPNINAAEH